jgi:hypothetical protein
MYAAVVSSAAMAPVAVVSISVANRGLVSYCDNRFSGTRFLISSLSEVREYPPTLPAIGEGASGSRWLAGFNPAGSDRPTGGPVFRRNLSRKRQTSRVFPPTVTVDSGQEFVRPIGRSASASYYKWIDLSVPASGFRFSPICGIEVGLPLRLSPSAAGDSFRTRYRCASCCLCVLSRWS